MYNTQEIANKIKQSAKNRNMTVKQLLEKCDLSINTISDLSKGQQISYINFAKIADYLNCSVDYLLGRTDNPEIRTDGSINIGNIGNNSNNNNHIQVSPETETQQEISSILSHLSFRERTELMTLIYKYFDEHNKGV